MSVDGECRGEGGKCKWDWKKKSSRMDYKHSCDVVIVVIVVIEHFICDVLS